MRTLFAITLTLACVTALGAGCGSDDSGSSNGPLSSAQNSAVIGGVFNTMPSPSTFSVEPLSQDDLLFGRHNRTTVNFSGSATVHCGLGGTEAVTGTGSGTVTGSTITFTESFTVVASACKFIGKDGNTYQIDSTGFTWSGNGTATENVSGSTTTFTYAGTFSANGQMDITGAVTETGNVDVSANMNVTVTDTSGVFALTVSGSYTGTEWGNSVSGTLN